MHTHCLSEFQARQHVSAPHSGPKLRPCSGGGPLSREPACGVRLTRGRPSWGALLLFCAWSWPHDWVGACSCQDAPPPGTTALPSGRKAISSPRGRRSAGERDAMNLRGAPARGGSTPMGLPTCGPHQGPASLLREVKAASSPLPRRARFRGGSRLHIPQVGACVRRPGPGGPAVRRHPTQIRHRCRATRRRGQRLYQIGLAPLLHRGAGERRHEFGDDACAWRLNPKGTADPRHVSLPQHRGHAKRKWCNARSLSGLPARCRERSTALTSSRTRWEAPPRCLGAAFRPPRARIRASPCPATSRSRVARSAGRASRSQCRSTAPRPPPCWRRGMISP